MEGFDGDCFDGDRPDGDSLSRAAAACGAVGDPVGGGWRSVEEDGECFDADRLEGDCFEGDCFDGDCFEGDCFEGDCFSGRCLGELLGECFGDEWNEGRRFGDADVTGEGGFSGSCE